ncbi:hypothetical protein [Laspinema olomoucense]|uniref:hypothetical protein n=1 Tax=Laspinema olomoucense TaxID=3231600 RepID=UPI0021BA742E|nr:hypothetical protein [Laspinema sp. D3d]MCT7972482.1 hypothetical protein [Laspinema sp. D3d]
MLTQQIKHCTPSTLKRRTQVLLIFTPWIAISAIASSPVLAATFAHSEGMLQFANFNHPLYSTNSFAGTNSLALIKADAAVTSMSYASASLSNYPYSAPFGNLFSSSLTLGMGQDYRGLSQSNAQIIGYFLIGQPDYFSFDFRGFLNIATFGNFPKFSQASGILAFALLDTTQPSRVNLLDYFTLAGQSSSVLDNNFVASGYSDLIQSTVTSHQIVNSNQSLAQLSVIGSLKRSFETPTHITLIAINAQQAEVKVPEPSFSLSLFLFGFGFVARIKHKKSIK